MGIEQDCCKEVGKRLQESKLYFKTTYRYHCKKDDSKCADHCRVFALSDAVDTDFQRACSHNAVTVYFLKAEECLEVVRGTTSEYTMQLGEVQAEDHLYEAKYAAAKIFE